MSIDVPPKFVPKFLQAPSALSGAPASGGVEADVDPCAVPSTPEQVLEFQSRVPDGRTPLTFYQKELARLLSLGKKTKEIADQLKCSTQFVYACMKNPQIVEEAERYRDRLFEGDVSDRLKELNASAFGVMEQILRDPGEKANLRLDAAKWILEKTTGKAIQAIDVQSSTLEAFHKLLGDMSQRGETLDVTPKELGEGAQQLTGEIEEVSGFDPMTWVNENT